MAHNKENGHRHGLKMCGFQRAPGGVAGLGGHATWQHQSPSSRDRRNTPFNLSPKDLESSAQVLNAFPSPSPSSERFPATSPSPECSHASFFTQKAPSVSSSSSGSNDRAVAGATGTLLGLLPHAQPMHLAVVQLLPPPPAGSKSGGGSDTSARSADGAGGPAASTRTPHVAPSASAQTSGQSAAAGATLMTRRVVAVGAAEWRTVLVRTRSVTVSVQLSGGPSGEIGGLDQISRVAQLLLYTQVSPLTHTHNELA